MTHIINVAIVEDNRLVREGIREMLHAFDDVSVVLAEASIEMATLRRAAPRVLLLDAGLENENCVALAESVQRELASTRVVVMDLLPGHEEIAQFVNVGVAGFILKDATLDDFVGTIRAVAEGGRVLPPRMTGTLFSQIAHAALQRSGPAAHELVRMTRREREVIAEIADGLSNKEIAQRLDIAPYTVKSHVRNVMEKLALHSRLQIAAYARQQDD